MTDSVTTTAKPKWTRGEVLMELNRGDLVPVPGITCGVMGIAKPPESGWYSLTHCPTGFSVGGIFGTRRGAKAAYDQIVAAYGDGIWDRLARNEVSRPEAISIKKCISVNEN